MNRRKSTLLTFWLFSAIILSCEPPITVEPPILEYDVGSNTYYSDSNGVNETYQEKLDIINENVESEPVGANIQNDNNPINVNPVIPENGDNPIGVNPSLLDLQKELDNGLYSIFGNKVDCVACKTVVGAIKAGGCTYASKLAAYTTCVALSAAPTPVDDALCIWIASFIFNTICAIGIDQVSYFDSGYLCNILYFHEKKCFTKYDMCFPEDKTQYSFCMAGCLCGEYFVSQTISLKVCKALQKIYKESYKKKIISFICGEVIGESIETVADCDIICKKYKEDSYNILDNCGNFVCDSGESGDICCIDCKCTNGYICVEKPFECASDPCFIPSENVYSCVKEADCIGEECTETPDCPDCVIPIEPCSENQKCGFNKDGVYCGDCDEGEKCMNGKCVITCGIDGCELDYGEDCCTCPLDCIDELEECVNEICINKTCGDGECVGSEWDPSSLIYCYNDCYMPCGDGKCESSELEDCSSCPKDCFCTGACCYGICCNAGEICDNDACPDINPCIKSFCCTPKTCDNLEKKCGTWPDGCGNSLDCGGCDSDSYCEDGKCKKYFDKGYCGDGWCVADEDCKNCVADCGCSNGEICLEIYGVCCKTKNCNEIEKECGIWSDWCGSPMDCGKCGAGFICSDGSCVGCDECSEGEIKCFGKTLYVECKFIDGCWQWDDWDLKECDYECKDNKSCIEYGVGIECSDCIKESNCGDGYTCLTSTGSDSEVSWCVKKCNLNEDCPLNHVCISNNCLSTNTEEGCYNGDVWLVDKYCNKGQFLHEICTSECQNGECVNNCVNECVEGKTKCITETMYKECKLIDGCWQWGDSWSNNIFICPSGYKCSNEKCNEVCSSEEKQCKPCGSYAINDCSKKYICMPWFSDEYDGFWHKLCGSNFDCPSNSPVCNDGICLAYFDNMCFIDDGDIWQTDECGAKIKKTGDCPCNCFEAGCDCN